MPAGEVIGYRLQVAPVRERGLKSGRYLKGITAQSRSREGAWIEIAMRTRDVIFIAVAPVRERGLKY